MDPTGAVLAGADVTVVASDAAAAAEKNEAKKEVKKEAQTDAEGVATIGQLTAGPLPDPKPRFPDSRRDS